MKKFLMGIFFNDNKLVNFLLSIVITVLLGVTYYIASASSLLAFCILVLFPIMTLAMYRERLNWKKRDRDYNILNVLMLCWFPLALILLNLIF